MNVRIATLCSQQGDAVPGGELCRQTSHGCSAFVTCSLEKLGDKALLLDFLPVACISVSGFKCGLPRAVEYFIKKKRKAGLSGKAGEWRCGHSLRCLPHPSTQVEADLLEKLPKAGGQ